MNKSIKYLALGISVLANFNVSIARENIGKHPKNNNALNKVASDCNATSAQTDFS